MFFALVASTLIGLLVRLIFVTAVDFPVNDGGMFYTMTRDIQENGYRLPEFTSYNDAGIPLAYPPLMFYVAGLLNDLTGLSLLTLFRILPLIASVLTIPAFFLISRNLLESRLAIGMSTLAFALIPRAFDWQISGGGITRAYGLLFAMLAIHQGIRLLMHKNRSAWPLIGLFGALSLLCHPEMGLFFVYSYAVLFIASGPRRPEFITSAWATALAGALTAPWWGWVLYEHGPSTLLDAGGSNIVALPYGIRILDPALLNEPFFPLHVALGFAGAVACVGLRKPLLPVWMLILFVFDPRKAPTDAAIPIALMEGVAIAYVVVPALELRRRVGPRTRRAFYLVAASFWAFSALASPIAHSSPLAAVSSEGREAFAWVSSNTPDSSRFVIISERPWAIGTFGEWFPAMTGRANLATVQGSEWMGEDVFRRSIELHGDLQECGDRDVRCIESWSDEAGAAYRYVLIVQPDALVIDIADEDECCHALRASLDESPDYRLVYSNSAVDIYEHRDD